MKLKKILIACFLLIFVNQIYAQNDVVKYKKEPLVIGEQVHFDSQILNENRILNIYLPLDYGKDPLQTYPVIYLLDGSMDEDFIHITGLVQFGSFSWINMVPESIVVGISNVDRERDLTFSSTDKEDQVEYPTTGKSENFIQFIEKELQPFIQNNYKISDSKTVIGQSLGGLLATEVLFKNPELFDNYILISPSLWWGNETLLTYTPRPFTSKKSVFIAVGNEGDIMERLTKELFDKLKSLQDEDSTIYYEFLENQTHGDALHLGVYHAFDKIFGKKED
ncbi:alpha/beta hydrolase [Bizionia argentinensis JUB59]|uniref:Alpha/beta hydrolase n=1 Tax=Bizionia argentinensis JUB59 TaxID=1046627 RepID=G2EBZ2_9FLAO|nr:alpha/beta hydrolase-fold protein [Bizionia argentinensis]EGV44029.1 alpha/beta hydrolase [Bizionia argentinensis JUB59]